MPTYNTGINRGNSPYGSDPIVPEPLSADIIQELPTQSTVMRMAQKRPMSTRTQRLTVLDTLPVAYVVASVLLVMGFVLIVGDLVAPIEVG